MEQKVLDESKENYSFIDYPFTARAYNNHGSTSNSRSQLWRNRKDSSTQLDESLSLNPDEQEMNTIDRVVPVQPLQTFFVVDKIVEEDI